MKRTGLFTIFVLLTMSIHAQESIMTYNIRYNNPSDGENRWENRKQEVAEMIKHYQPDILGIQEGLNDQVKYLNTALLQYDFVGVGRDDGVEKGEYAAIFFNKETTQLLETKTYWLSESPDIISVGWDASMERIVTYAKFKDRTNNKIIHVFNCHYDHIGKIARKKSSELILKLIKDKGIENERILVIGDLNSSPDDKPIQILKTKLKDSYKISQSKAYGPVGTFNGFNTNKSVTKRIDYILVRNLKVRQYTNIDDRRKNNLWLSDHLPVMIILE